MGADHLGSPRHVTDGGRYAPDGTMMTHGTGQIVGEQAFGPYGEQMIGEFNGKRFPSGYTGHINEDATGLIYMRGRYYSPLWHRFVNSDQGADPNSLNQYAYVGGRPFSATDPSGMEMYKAMINGVLYYFDDLERFMAWATASFGGGSFPYKMWLNGEWLDAAYVVVTGGSAPPTPFAATGAPAGYAFPGYGDPRGGGGAGGGGPAGSGAPAGPKAPKVTPKNDCDEGPSGAIGLGVDAGAEFVMGGPFGALNVGGAVYGFANGDIALVGTVGSSHIGVAAAEHAWGWGANAGTGVTLTYTNAKTPDQLAGQSRVTTVTYGPLQFQYSQSSNGVFGYSFGLSFGFGSGISTYNYNSTVKVIKGSKCGN